MARVRRQFAGRDRAVIMGHRAVRQIGVIGYMRHRRQIEEPFVNLA